MKRVTKVLAVLLVLVLAMGAIPVQAAAAPARKKASKVLYLGGCTGTKADGTKAKFYESVKASKLLKNYSSKTMDIKLESSNTDVCKVSNSNGTITAVGRGKAKITISVRSKANEKLLHADPIVVTITVKKNADPDFSITGIKDGGEYKVGDSLTVVMTRKNDDDYRSLTCAEKGVTITKKNDVGSKYVVKFKEAGEYNFTATTFQSNTYKGATQKKTFKVTVKGAAPTPTVTPTPTTAPTDKPTPTPVASDVKVKQTALDTIELTGVANAADLKAKDLKIYYTVGDFSIDKTGISSVTADGDTLKVQMLSNFDGNTEYYVTYTGFTGDPLKFKAATAATKDIAAIKVTKQRVLINKNEDIGLRYYNADGVDITSAVATTVIPAMTVIEGGISDFYVVSGNQIYFLNADKTAVVEISVMTGTSNTGSPIYVTTRAAITSYQPQFKEFIYTVTTEDGVYMKTNETQVHSFSRDAVNPVIEGYFVYEDEAGNKTYKTLDEEMISGIGTTDPTILMDGVKSVAGGWGLIANKTGATVVLFYKGDKVFAQAPVTVLEERKPASVTATVSKASLNVNGAANDSLDIVAVVKDQYGNELKGQPLVITQTDNTKTTTATVPFSGFDSNGKLTVPGGTITMNSGVKTGIIIATVSCGNISSAPISFSVADYAEANIWTLASNPDSASIAMDNSIKQGDAAPSEVRLSIEGRNGAFSVRKEIMVFYPGKQPTAQIKASDLGVTPGTKTYIFTVQKDGSFMSAFPANVITNTSTELVFKSFDYQSRLEAGTYVITAYQLVPGTENSQIGSIGQRTIIVTNNQAPVQFRQVKDKSTAVTAVDVARDCFEFYIDGKKLDPTAVIDADVSFSGTGSKYVKSVKLSYNNTVYGDYVQNVSISGSVIN